MGPAVSAAAAMAAFTGATPTLPSPAVEPGSKADLMQKLAAELARLQIKVKEKREREAAAKAAAAAANDEAAMFAKLMAEIGELKKELGEE